MAARNGEAQVELVVERVVDGVAEPAAWTAGIIGASDLPCGTGHARRSLAIGEAISALRRIDDQILLNPLPARQVAHRQQVTEAMIEDGGGLVDHLVLAIEILIAIIAAIGDARQRSVIERVLVIGHAIKRRVLVFLMRIEQRQRRRAVHAEFDGRRDTPSLVPIHIAARDVIFMIHGVEAHGDEVRHAHIAVDRRTIIIGRADTRLHQRFVIALGALRDDVDVAADRARAAEYGIGAVGDFDLFDVERVRAAILRAVAHAVDADVGIGALSAQVDAVAITAAAFARAEGDARNGGQHVAQRQQILFLDGLVADHGDGLRRVQQRAHIFGRFRLFHLHCRLIDGRIGDGHAAQALTGGPILRVRRRGEGNRAYAGQRQKGRRRCFIRHGY